MKITPARRFLCLFVCVVLSPLLPTEALAAQGITRTAGENFNGAGSITALKGDTVWLWAEASIDGARCWWDEGPPLYWPLDEDMTWSVTQGDLDDSHQYYREEDWQIVEGGPPFPVLLEVVERWQGSRTCFFLPSRLRFCLSSSRGSIAVTPSPYQRSRSFWRSLRPARFSL